ncbi:MAG: SMP-30/gluconolactonase/LRE family protein [Terriglobia bacterium]
MLGTLTRGASRLSICLLVLTPGIPRLLAAPAGDGIVAPGAKLVRLSEGFKFTEGPAADAEGNVFFTDQPNNRIMEWSVNGKLSVFMQPAGRANGMFFDKKGNLYACADLHNQLWEISPSKKVTVLVKSYQGKLLNGPNDVWVRPDGGIYITDPFYKRDYWTRGPMEQPGQYVYYMPPDHKKLIRVIDDLQKPNGIIGTPNGKTLYVADIQGNKTYSYHIDPNGTLSDQKLFVNRGSDGMTIDSRGDVYLSGKGVTVFNSRGEQIDKIPVPQPWTGNITFGGRHRSTLFITASDSLYSVQTRVHGVR